MSRAKVTQAEVFATCEQLRTQGIEPSTNRVRGILRKGSMTTITRYLREWEALQDNVTSSPSDVPASLLSFAETVARQAWDQASAAAEQRVADAHAQVEDRRRKWHAEIETAMALVDQVQEEKAVLEARNQRQQADLDALREEGIQARGTISQLTGKNEELQEELGAKERRIIKLDEFLATKDRRESALLATQEKLEESVEQLRQQLADATRQLQEARSNNDRLQDTQTRLTEEASRQRQALEQAEQVNADQATAARSLELELAEARADLRHFKGEAHSTQQHLTQALATIATLEANLQGRVEALEEAKVAYEEARRELHELSQTAAEQNGRLLSQQEHVRQLTRDLARCQQRLGGLPGELDEDS